MPRSRYVHSRDAMLFAPNESLEYIVKMRDGWLLLADDHPVPDMADSYHYAWLQANQEIAKRLWRY